MHNLCLQAPMQPCLQLQGPNLPVPLLGGRVWPLFGVLCPVASSEHPTLPRGEDLGHAAPLMAKGKLDGCTSRYIGARRGVTGCCGHGFKVAVHIMLENGDVLFQKHERHLFSSLTAIINSFTAAALMGLSPEHSHLLCQDSALGS